MNDESSEREPGVIPVEKPGKPVDIESPSIAHVPEVIQPRHMVFGEVEVTEDLTADLLTPHEKDIYQNGFNTLKQLVDGSDNIGRMVLTSPRVAAGIIGLHPLVNISVDEAGITDNRGDTLLLYQAFQREGIDFSENYDIVRSVYDDPFLLNLAAAENVLRDNQEVLGISLPETPLQRDALLSQINDLLTASGDKAHITQGLLGGIPLTDCQDFVKSHKVEPLSGFTAVQDLQTYLPSELLAKETGIPARVSPVSMLRSEMAYLYFRDYVPDIREDDSNNKSHATAEGFGVTWEVSRPPKEGTLKHCQKMLQVDRELGLLEWVHKQQSSYSVEDNLQAIQISKQMALE